MPDFEKPRPVYTNPDVYHEYDEDGQPYDPTARWSLSFGCTLSIGFEGDDLHLTVSTSGHDQRTGTTKRTVTREQVRDYAHQLLALVGEDRTQIERMARAMFNRNHPGRDYDADAGEAERDLHHKDARAAFDALIRTASETGTPIDGGVR
ncbi:hypothetical protein [Saccharopolyspora shandongensis]|uniref:hypothetical protein n=1 Tax=Saccharopolyspora shandongensis TaxID=418495 RepID=UPI0033C90AFA